MAEKETTYNQSCPPPSSGDSPNACKSPDDRLREKEGELTGLNSNISGVEKDLGGKKLQKQRLEDDIKALKSQAKEVNTIVNEYAEKFEEIKRDKYDLKCLYENRKTVLKDRLEPGEECGVACFRNLVDRAIAILEKKKKNAECISEKRLTDFNNAVTARKDAEKCYEDIKKKKDTLLGELANGKKLKDKIEKPGGPGGNDERKTLMKSYFYTLELGKVLCKAPDNISETCKNLINDKNCVTADQLPQGPPEECEGYTPPQECDDECKLTIIESSELETRLIEALCTIETKLDSERNAQDALTEANTKRDVLKAEYEDKKKKRDEIIIKWIVGELASDIINRIKELNFPSQQ